MSSDNTSNKEKVKPIAFIHDLTRVIKEKDEIIDSKNTDVKRLWISLFSVLGLASVFAMMAFKAEIQYFATDGFGRIVPVKGYDTPHLTRERRMQHAEWIVRSMHSLDFVDKDRVLNEIQPYFDPYVFKDYIKKQSENGFFNQMNKYNIKYIASVEPATLIGSMKSGVSYSDPKCYQVDYKDGKEIETDCIKNNLDSRRGHTEVYEFTVNRRVFVNAVDKGIQKLRVRLVITRVSLARYSQGYIVSEYTETMLSDI